MAVVGPNIPDSIYRMIKKTFDRSEIEVYESSIEGVRNQLALFKYNEVIATSPLQEISDSLLMVNSYAYKTGTIGIDEVKAPDVIKRLENIRFSVRGPPKSNYEELMLILISRHIEKLSYIHEDSVHRASFQNLSRIRDEVGTQRIYKQLAENKEVHVYGRSDWIPPEDWGLNVHSENEEEVSKYWFVVHRSSEKDMALIAYQDERNLWDAVWTMDPNKVEEVEEHIIENYQKD
jgi:hypothetical protein